MSIPQSGGGPIERHEQLAEYLESGCKPREDWRIGTDKKIRLLPGHALPLPYGKRSILAVLEGLRMAWLGASRRRQTDWPDQRRRQRIAEPGGQLELSGAPLETIHEMTR